MSLRQQKAMASTQVKQYHIDYKSNGKQTRKLLSVPLFKMEHQLNDYDHLFTNHNKSCHDANSCK